MKNNVYLINVLLLVIAAVIGWLSWNTTNLKVMKSPKNTDPVDAYMVNADMTQFTKDGKLNFILNSPRMAHHETSNTTSLTSPKFKIYNDNGIPWDVTADNGMAYDGIEKINLWDDVDIHGIPDHATKPITLLTSKADYYPNKRFAQTDQPVQIKQTDSEVRATGMKVYFDTSSAQLLSNVRGEYVPN